MPEYTHTSLPLYGLHVPGATLVEGPDGTLQAQPLPGIYQIWTEIEGVPLLLFERKAGKLLQKIAAAQSATPSPPPTQ